MKLEEFITKAKDYGYFYVTRNIESRIAAYFVNCYNHDFTGVVTWESNNGSRSDDGVICDTFKTLLRESATVQKVVDEVRS